MKTNKKDYGKEIDWGKVANEYGLTPAQFETQILLVSSIVGAMRISSTPNAEFVYSCEDPDGKIELTVKRVAEQKGHNDG